MRRTSVLSAVAIVLALSAPVHAARLSVDASGERVVISADPLTPILYERHGDTWERIAFGRGNDFVMGGVLVPEGLVVTGELRTWRDGKIAAEGVPIAALEGERVAEPPWVAGDLLFFRTSRVELEGRLVRASDKGLAPVATVETRERTGASLVDAIALSETRLAQLVQDPSEGCRVVVVERGDGDWSTLEVVRPAECRPPEDEPEPPSWRAVSIALDDDRMAIGLAHYDDSLKPGEIVVYRKDASGWRATGRITRPDVPDEDLPDGFVPFGFGHRLALDGPRLYAGDGFATPIDHGYSSVSNGVMVLVEKKERWELERHYVHTTPLATFGSEFAVRGERLFVDSPDEKAAYVFERRGGEWHEAGRIPPETAK